jgi:hypothetical protein
MDFREMFCWEFSLYQENLVLAKIEKRNSRFTQGPG